MIQSSLPWRTMGKKSSDPSDKKKRKSQPASQEPAAEEQAPVEENAAESPAVPSTQNFLNQLKQARKRVEEDRAKAGDDAKVQLLDKYSKLSRYDQEKTLLLQLWAKDRSLSWWKTYEEFGGSTYTERKKGLSGWGSRLILNYIPSLSCAMCIMCSQKITLH